MTAPAIISAIETERIRQNMTAKELCRRAGVAVSAYNYLGKVQSANLSTVLCLAGALGMELRISVKSH